MRSRVLRVELHVGGLDGQLAPLRHGVAGVHDEVHENLLQLSGIGHHHSEGGTVRDGELDVRSDETLQHLRGAVDGHVQIEDPRLEDLLPAERQQLPRQSRRTRAGSDDLLQVVSHRIPGLEICGEHLAVAEDDGQEVVEVVRDASREVADGLHLLTLPELALQPVPRRDVERHGEAARSTAEHELLDRDLDVDEGPVLLAVPV